MNDKLTPVEWELMEAIWRLDGSPSVREVLDHAYPGGEKAYTTVQTIMNTLEKKGMLRRRKIGLVNFYTPNQSREEMVKVELRHLISRIFNGSVPALASTLLDSHDLTTEEISAIQQLLDEKEAQLKGE